MAKRRISMEVLKELDKMNYTFVKSYPLSHVITMSDDEIRRNILLKDKVEAIIVLMKNL